MIEEGSFPSIKLVSHFSDGDDDITPDLTSLKGLEVGLDQIVAGRWAWMQPVFRKGVRSSKGGADPERPVRLSLPLLPARLPGV